MRISSLELQNFRSFSKQAFRFSPRATVVVGPNGSGKSNLLEAISLLTAGEDLRSSVDRELIHHDEDFCSIEGRVESASGEPLTLSVQIVSEPSGRTLKHLKVNGIGRNLINFSRNIASVSFRPEDLDLVLGPPEGRRRYLNQLLSLVSREYHQASLSFEKVRRERNHLLQAIREGSSGRVELEVWDEKFLELAPLIFEGRQKFFDYLEKNSRRTSFRYSPSLVSATKLSEYREREINAGLSLFGPHRDDFGFESSGLPRAESDLALFGSRGEQRLAVFNLKMMEIGFLKETYGSVPILLLDDIFSELDEVNRRAIISAVEGGQVIITTTEKNYAADLFGVRPEVISLG